MRGISLSPDSFDRDSSHHVFTPQLNSLGSSYCPSATQNQISQSHNYTPPNTLGHSGYPSSSSSNWTWNSQHGLRHTQAKTSTNQHILSVASHENLVNARNPAYMQLFQHVSDLTKEFSLQEAKFFGLECVSALALILLIQLTIQCCRQSTGNHMTSFCRALELWNYPPQITLSLVLAPLAEAHYCSQLRLQLLPDLWIECNTLRSDGGLTNLG